MFFVADSHDMPILRPGSLSDSAAALKHESSTAAGPEPASAVGEMKAFTPPRRFPGVDLYLDSNEGPPLPESVLQMAHAMRAEDLRGYPSPARVQRLWAQRLGVPQDHLFPAAGGDDAIHRLCIAFLEPGREIILPVPTFEMLGRYPRLTGATSVEVPWKPGEDYPTRAVLDHVTGRTAVIAMVSPNNPTGSAATVRDLRQIAKAAPHAVILLDQAYCEFADTDLTPAALDLPNVITIRTLSKAWGLAGLRLGCAVGRPELLRHLNAAGGPFPVSGPSLAIAAAALTDRTLESDRARYIARIWQERDRLVSLLQQLPRAESWPSQGNFILARFADAAGVHASLLNAGIAVARLPEHWGLENCLRISCPGNLLDFERLAGALIDATLSQGRSTCLLR
jgi:histidinol-phosphate aminotransferase